MRKLKPKNSGIYLFESPATRSNLLGLKSFILALNQKGGYRYELFRAGPKTALSTIKERIRFFLSPERQLGMKQFWYIQSKRCRSDFYISFYDSLCGIREAEEFQFFKYKEVLLGDLVYDEYLRRGKNFTLNFDDNHFYRIFHELVSYCDQYFKLIKGREIKGVVVSNTIYHFAIPSRIASLKGIPAYQLTSETVYRLDENRMYAYTEFLDYNSTFRPSPKSEIAVLEPKVLKEMQKSLGAPFTLHGLLGSNLEKIRIDSSSKLETRVKVLVAVHDFSDSPHCYGINFYPDFYLWLERLGEISLYTDYDWYLKPHPLSIGDYRKPFEILKEQYPKFTVIDPFTTKDEIIRLGVNIVLTVYGTVGWEFPALGIPVLNASSVNPHCNFNFAITPGSKSDYEYILNNLGVAIRSDINISEIVEFYYLHSYTKLQSFIYKDYDRYLQAVGGYDRAMTTYALAFDIDYEESNKYLEKDSNFAIANFLDSEDFRLDYHHFR